MADYDGKIQMALDVSPEDAIKSFKRLQSEAQKLLDSLSTDNLTKSEEKSAAAMSKIVSKGQEAAKQIEKLSKPVETKEYTKLSAEYDKLAAKLETLSQRRDQLVSKGAKDTDPALHALDEKLVSVRSRLYDIDVELDKMVAEGKQFTINEEGLERAKNSLVDINNQLAIQNEAVGQTVQGQNESAQRLSEIEQKILAIQQDAGPIDEEFFKISTALTRVNEELEQLYARQAELEQAGRGLGFEEYDANLAKIRELEAEQERLNGQVDAYREKMSEGPALTVWERVGEFFRQLGQDLVHPIQAIQRLRQSTDEASGSASRAESAFSKLLSTIGGVAGKFLASVTGVNRLKSALQGVTQKATQSSFNFKKLFNTLLKYGIGVRSLFVLYRKIRSAIAENIQYYALMNNGMNQTNRAISAMQSSLNALKGALAGAFVPIITHVSPMLTNLIDNITAAVTAIGMLIAKLTGAKSYLKAVKKDSNYAAGLSSGGGGKSAQEKYDEAVKKAQEKYDKKVAETEAKNAERMAKAEEKQAKAAAKLEKAQQKANNKLADFDDLNVLGVETLEDLEDVEADLLDMPELELPSLEDFTGSGGGAGSPFGFEEVPLDGLEWNWDDLLDKCEELGRRLADMLNNIFADEDLAKKIGNTIGNLINMAIRFAYGFVDEFNFHQFGRWVGALLQEAIETIDWGLLGETIGKGLNGIADSIIGFFETYNVGTLGASISEMLNRAIAEIDADKIGLATLEALQAPLLELKEVLTDTHWMELGGKISDWFQKVFSSEGLKGETLGTTIGKTLGAAINAGVDFILGLDISGMIEAFGWFIEDIFVGAVGEIKWYNVLKALVEGLFSVFEGLATVITVWATELTIMLEEAINDKLHFDLFPKEDIENAKREVELLKDGLIDLGDAITNSSQAFVDSMGAIDEGMQYSFDQLVRFQSGAGLTDEQIQKMISSMQEYARTNGETFDAASLGLEGYTGNWETYRDTVLGVVDETNEKIESSKGPVNVLAENTDVLKEKAKETGEAIKTEADTTAEKLDHTAAIGKDHLGILDEAISTSDTNVNEYSDSAVEALSKVDAKTGEVSINFEQMTTLVQTQLDSLTTMIDTWYQEMIATYFSYDAWLLMLQEGPLLALTDFFTTLFLLEWDTQMQMWWDEHVLIWFTAEKWQAELFIPFFTFLQAEWAVLLKWWDEVIKKWYEDLKKKWTKFLESCKTACEKFHKQLEECFNKTKEITDEAWTEIEELITEKIDAAKEAVLAACDEMRVAIMEIIGLMSELESMGMPGGGGGSSSSSGSHGGSSGSFGGGSRTHDFMPMLDIMHFEDNLGMSAFQFPELATGAVIPPNNKFLAVLGDQKSGMNIETPLATMIEAFRSVMDEYMTPGYQNATMEVDGETFARLMMPHMMDEMVRLGYNTEIIEGT